MIIRKIPDQLQMRIRKLGGIETIKKFIKQNKTDFLFQILLSINALAYCYANVLFFFALPTAKKISFQNNVKLFRTLMEL